MFPNEVNPLLIALFDWYMIPTFYSFKVVDKFIKWVSNFTPPTESWVDLNA